MNSGWDSKRSGDKEGVEVGELGVFQINVIHNF
jgi:hypothetical protein